MRITVAASEGVPFSKTGGLADVVGALPHALAEMGHEVTVFLPKYKVTHLDNPTVAIPNLTIPFNDHLRFCQILDAGKRSGVQFYFVDHPDFSFRDYLYTAPTGDYPDNAERFMMFCRAVLESSKRLGVPDLFHAHDWQAAMVPVLLRTQYSFDSTFDQVACVFTVHNLGYQGIFPAPTMPRLILGWDLFTVDRLEFYNRVNFMKGGLVYADWITTVSRKYAQEIQTPEYGFGLDSVVRRRRANLTGILNGVNYQEWNPMGDPWITAHYSAKDLKGKRECKLDLLKEFGLNEAHIDWPLIGIVSRFAVQKGFDLIADVTGNLLKQDVLMVVLGTGDAEYEALFRDFHAAYPDKLGLKIAYSNPLAHKIEAGADIFLMPSHYEPCGLNQIYSLKYGTVPVVRATGGLDDTIEQWNPKTGKGTGFKFERYSSLELWTRLQEALEAYKDQTSWHKLMKNGMGKDFSWQRESKEYVKVYEQAVKLRRR
jgi:starch synthase